MILFTDPEYIRNESVAINSFFEEGLEILHVRKPNSSSKEMLDFLRKINASFHNRIMIHQYYELADFLNLRGIHFTENSKKSVVTYAEKKYNRSMAIHSLSDFENVPKSIEYILLSPIFPSISKSGYENNWNEEELIKMLHSKRHFKKVALGGITSENATIAINKGFDDFAILGSIWEPFKSGLALEKTIEIFKSFRK